MSNPRPITGKDAYVYLFNPLYNKNTSTANLGGAISLLGVGQELSLDFTLDYADATPSAQILKEKAFTGYDFDLTIKNIVRSGGGQLTNMVFDTSIDARVVFQEEYTGAIMYIFCSLQSGSYKWGRDSRMEDLKMTNTGPIGTLGASIFRLYGGQTVTGGIQTSAAVAQTPTQAVQVLQAGYASQSAIAPAYGAGLLGGIGL